MKRSLLRKQTGVLESDNTKVVRPVIQERIPKAYQTPAQPQFVQDNRNDWQRQRDRKKADEAYNKYMEDKKMQKGLQHLNGFLTFTDYATMGLGAGSLLLKGAKYAGKKAIKQVAKTIADSRKMGKGQQYTNNLIRLLGDRKDATGIMGQFSASSQNVVDYYKSMGVDMARFTDKDIRTLGDLRHNSVMKNSPNGRSATIQELKLPKMSMTDIDLYDSQKGKIGKFTVTNNPTEKSFHAGNIESYDDMEHGISEALYNSTIDYAHQTGKTGVISGEKLNSPEITTKVWRHYPTKELLGKYGRHKYNFGRTINTGASTPPVIDNKGAVYLLNKSSYKVPTKSLQMFHPSMINTKTWKLNPPDWNSKNVFKFGIPGFIGSSTLMQNE